MKYLIFTQASDARAASAWLDDQVDTSAVDVGTGRHVPHDPSLVYCPAFPRWDGGQWAVPIDSVTEPHLGDLRAAVTFTVPDPADLDASWQKPLVV